MSSIGHSKKHHRGFTLIELLVVIAVTAVLATIAVVILNPVELLAQARDAKRLEDVEAIKKAINLATVASSGRLDGDGPNFTYSCKGQVDPGDSSNHQKLFVSVPLGNGEATPTIAGWTVQRASSANLIKINGQGWLPIDLLNNGAVFSALPVDPTNTFTSGLYYSYVCGSYGFSLRFESNKYKAQFYTGDGGVNNGVYETGSTPSDIPPLPPAGADYSDPGAPIVATSEATDIFTTSATLNGLVNPNGATTTAWFRYDTTDPGACNTTFGTPTATYDLGSEFSNEPYSHGLTGLTASTTYYYCAIASNSVGANIMGSVEAFTTYAPPNTAPTVTTTPATSLTTTTATINGLANPNSVSSSGWFRYRTTPSASCDDSDAWGTRVPTLVSLSDTDLGSGHSPAPYSQNLTGLTSGSTYYFCAVAKNTYGTTPGNVVSFTAVGAPTVTTTPATSVTATSATLNGTATPNGVTTTAWFRYRTTTSASCVDNDTWGIRVPANSSADPTLGAGSAPITYSQFLSGLSSANDYWYCAIASNSYGTSLGAVLPFSFSSSAPTVSTGQAIVDRPGAAARAHVSSGGFHTCTLLSDGTVKCWGSYYYSYSNYTLIPNLIPGISNATQVSLGTYHSCALLSTGFIKCWSINGNGQPVSVSGISNAIQIGAGAFHTCAVLSDGTVKCWGQNFYGQLGNGNTTDSSTPVLVPGISNAVQVSAGFDFSCARLSDSTIKCWGNNNTGQLGTSSNITHQSYTPIAVTGISNAVKISSGSQGRYSGQGEHSCALLSDSTIKCWGANGSGQLGNPQGGNSVPVVVPGILNATDVSAGGSHSCATLSGGTINCWGSNIDGQLGNGTTTNSSTPVAVSGISAATEVSTGGDHTCARLSDSSIKCWGSNAHGQLGDGSKVNRLAPIVVPTSSAVFYGSAVTNGAITTGWLRYRTASPSPYTCVDSDTWGTRLPSTGGTVSAAGDNGVYFSETVQNLLSSTTYYFCAFASNSFGTDVSDSVGSFNTSPVSSSRPETTVLPATAVTTSSATINASADPNGFTSTGWFRYYSSDPGVCYDYDGTRLPPEDYSVSYPGSPLGSGTSSVSYSQNLTGLASGTTYFFCAFANNVYGSSTDEVLSFTTAAAPITVTLSATAVASETATLNGSANANNIATTAWFRYDTADPSLCNDTFGTATTPTSSPGSGSSAVAYSENLTGLIPSTEHYFCAIASNSEGTTFGSVLSFITAAAGAPAPGSPAVVTGTSTTSTVSLSSTQVSTGPYFTCALQSDASIVCFGQNNYGQLGNGTNVNSAKPVSVSGISNATQFSTGIYHACALLSAGTVKCWGQTANSYIPVSVNGISNATQVAAGGYHDCALISGGTVKCWGYNGSGQLGNGTTTDSLTPVSVSGISNATQISAGYNHTCARLSDGTVKCWGDGSYYQIGANNSSSPVFVSGISNATQIASGAYHTCAVISGGTIKCWGKNEYGELGNGSANFAESNPASVSGISNATQVTAGEFHACARLSDSTVRCWGRNYDRQLGDGTANNSSTPVAVSSVSNATQVSAGWHHTCARLSGNGLTCWGNNSYGEAPEEALGISTATLNGSANPTGSTTTGWFRYSTVNPGTCSNSFGIRAPATGGSSVGSGTTVANYSQNITGLSVNTTYYYCAIASNSSGTATGEVQVLTTSAPPTTATSSATGIASTSATLNGTVQTEAYPAEAWFRYSLYNYTSCVSFNDSVSEATASTTINPNSSAASFSQNISGLSAHTTYYYCAIASNSSGIAYGAVLTFTTLPETAPPGSPTVVTQPADTSTSVVSSATQVSSGGLHTCGMFPGSTVKCWGNNSAGQLGDGTTTNSFAPVVAGLSNATQVSSGYSHTCARLSDSTIKCWGNNSNGQLGNGTTTDNSNPGLVPGLSNATQVSAGGGHTCARLSDSTVKCWGENNNGQLGNNSTTDSSSPVAVSGISNATEVVAGGQHTCARLSNSTIKCWGKNSNGQLGDTTTIDSPVPGVVTGILNATQISAGWNHTCARLSDSTVKCWGENGAAQLGNGDTTYTDSSTPVSVTGILTATQVSAGNNHTCARLVDSTIKCWGHSGNGQLGNGTTLPGNTPTPVSAVGVANATQISAANRYTCALLSDATIKCWGDNTYGQLGNGNTTDSSTPAPVSVSSATLNGTANPNGSSATGWFRYSLANPTACDNTFGTRVPAGSGGTPLGSATGVMPYSEDITGLSVGLTYYYCAIAQNATGLGYGALFTFTITP